MLEQHPRLITATDIHEKRESPLTLHPKLFSTDHAPDIVGTSGKASGTRKMTKQEIMKALKDTCVLLDEKKTQFELMIHSLEGENTVAEEQVEDEEADNADNGNEDSKEDSDSSSGTAE
jgi:hypothetical protein